MLASEALRHGAWITLFLGCKVHHTCLYLAKRSPDMRATTDSDNSRLIAAYYLSTLKGRKAALAGWLAYSGQFTHIPIYQLQVRCRPVKVRRSKTDVPPMSYTANRMMLMSVFDVIRHSPVNSHKCEINLRKRVTGVFTCLSECLCVSLSVCMYIHVIICETLLCPTPIGEGIIN